MTKAIESAASKPEDLDQLLHAARNGLVVIDSSGHVVGAAGDALTRLNGGLEKVALPSLGGGLECSVKIAEIEIDGQRTSVCVLTQTRPRKETVNDLMSAIEAVMSDTSWLARAIVEKVNAWRQSSGSIGDASDLERLTAREREILALICEGRSDAEMGKILGLSQNTIRNHVASLYRKIGVNRRGAAIIWARERAITAQEVLSLTGTRRVRGNGHRDGRQ